MRVGDTDRDFEFAVAAGDCALTVTLASAAPLPPRVTVTLIVRTPPQDGGFRSCQATAVDGRAEFRALPAGSMLVVASAFDGRRWDGDATVELAGGANEIRIDFAAH